VTVAPVADGQPVTTSLVYHPQVLLVTLVLLTIGGVLEVVGVARLWRQRSSTPSS
jgi:high-affinity K+ transport system ATPase subunit B